MKPLIYLFSPLVLLSCERQKVALDTSPPTHSPVAEQTAGQTAGQGEKKTCCAEHPAPAATAISSDSLYQLQSNWTDQAGESLELRSLAGKIQLVTMGYSTCKFACPRLMADMLAIKSGLSESALEQVHFTFISIDPDRDTPARLAEYAKENHTDPKLWSYLTSDSASVQELAVVLGTQYRRLNDSDFAHSNIITVLNRSGEIIHRQEGLAVKPAKTIAVIESEL